jgi:hypothetical protein
MGRPPLPPLCLILDKYAFKYPNGGMYSRNLRWRLKWLVRNGLTLLYIVQ